MVNMFSKKNAVGGIFFFGQIIIVKILKNIIYWIQIQKHFITVTS